MADKRIYDLLTLADIDDLDENVFIWMDKKAPEGEPALHSWKVRGDIFVKIMNNFATKFVPNVTATEVGKCYWHKGELYVCNVAYTGDWVPGNFTATSIDALFARKDVLSALQEALETTNGNVTALTTYAQNVAGKVDALDKFSVYFDDKSADLAKTTCTVLNVGVGNEVELGGYTSADYKGVFKPCIKGQVFRVKGTGNNNDSLRLWGFTDGDGVLLKVAPLTDSESDYITLFAPADGYIAVNAFGSTGGLLVQSSVDDKAKALDSGIKDVNDRVDYTNDNGLYYVDSTSLLTLGSIALDVGIGNTVTLTPSTSTDFRCTSVACKKGQPFKIIGAGGSAARLWGFVDSESKLASVCDANVTASDYITVNAPADGYLVMNARSGQNPRSLLVVGDVTNKLKEIDRLREQQSFDDGMNGYYSDVTDTLAKATCTELDVGIGNQVALGQYTSENYKGNYFPCKKYQSFKIKGTGHSRVRLWGFTDSNGLLLAVADGNAIASDYIVLTAPANGYFVCNVAVASDSGVLVMSNVTDKINDVDGKIDGDYNVVSENIVTYKRHFVTNNASVGDTVDPTPAFESGYECLVCPCSRGDEFFVTGKGFQNHRLWMFTDSSYKVTAVSAASATGDNTKITAPANGYLIYNNYANRQDGWHMGVVQKKVKVAKKLEEYLTVVHPWADFRMDTDVVDVSSVYANFNMSSTANRKLAMEQVYAFMDGLVANYPSLVTKFDLAEHLGIEYPRYANGISSGDAEYEETPAYKTYAYKISYSNSNAGNAYPWKFVKKKIVLFAGVHGGEVAACVNSAIFAYRLLHDCAQDSNLFGILSAFDVYIVPCVNGYGIYHQTRVNANLVNINRNYATSNWSVAGAGTIDYTGPSPESEFETKLTCGLVRELKPEIAIDHHNYSSQAFQFYGSFGFYYQQNTMYQIMNLMGCAFKKKYPEYFGSTFSALIDTGDIEACKEKEILPGRFTLWATEQNVLIPLCFEVGDNTRYYDGRLTDTGRLFFDDKIMNIAEYTIRAHLVKFCELVLRMLKD